MTTSIRSDPYKLCFIPITSAAAVATSQPASKSMYMLCTPSRLAKVWQKASDGRQDERPTWLVCNSQSSNKRNETKTMWWLWWHTDKRVHDSHESLRTTQHSSDSGNHKSFRSLDIHLPLGHSTDRTECEL